MYMPKLLPLRSTIIFVCLCFLLPAKNFAQQQPDSNTIKANIQTCIDSVTANPGFAEALASRMLVASNNIKYPWGIFMNTTILGAIACNKGEFDHALKLHEIALAYGRVHRFKQKESTTLGNLAKDYSGKGDHKKAIDLYLEAAKVAQEINDTLQVGQALQGVGQTYNKIGYSAEAIRYCSQAVEIFKKKKRYMSLVWAYNNIAAAYMDSARFDSTYHYLWLHKDAYDKATGGAPAKTDFYINLAICCDSLGLKDSAAYYFEKAITTGRQTGDEFGMQSALFYLAVKEEQAGNSSKAIRHYKEALQLTEKYNNLEGSIASTNALSKLYARTGDYANAYKYSVAAAALNDRYLDQEKIKAVTAQNTKFEKQQLQFEFEKKAAATQLVNQQKITRRNILLYSFIALALLLAAVIFFVVKYFRQKAVITASRNNELKQRLLLTQMNPHFIFNSVDNIQSLIYSNKNEDAISYLTKFSKLTRQILENSRENYISLAEELHMMDNYITIQKLLYNKHFRHSITVDESINSDEILLPPMLTQPFIENAIRHGLKDKKEDGLIAIRFYKDGNALFFEVTDNGTGLVAKEKENGQRSLSTQITRERLESISPDKNIVIHTGNITDDAGIVKGVKTFFEIPYIQNN